MRFEKFTGKLQTAVADAQSLAVGRGHNQLDPGHLLMALLEDRDAGLKGLVDKAGGDATALRSALSNYLDGLPEVGQFDGEVQPSRDFVRLMNLADREAQKRGDQFIASELVLVAALSMNNAITKLLTQAGLTQKALAAAIDTPKIALAPRRDLFSVPSSSIIISSISTCSVASTPTSASAISPLTAAQASSTPLPR